MAIWEEGEEGEEGGGHGEEGGGQVRSAEEWLAIWKEGENSVTWPCCRPHHTRSCSHTAIAFYFQVFVEALREQTDCFSNAASVCHSKAKRQAACSPILYEFS